MDGKELAAVDESLDGTDEGMKQIKKGGRNDDVDTHLVGDLAMPVQSRGRSEVHEVGTLQKSDRESLVPSSGVHNRDQIDFHGVEILPEMDQDSCENRAGGLCRRVRDSQTDESGDNMTNDDDHGGEGEEEGNDDHDEDDEEYDDDDDDDDDDDVSRGEGKQVDDAKAGHHVDGEKSSEEKELIPGFKAGEADDDGNDEEEEKVVGESKYVIKKSARVQVKDETSGRTVQVTFSLGSVKPVVGGDVNKGGGKWLGLDDKTVDDEDEDEGLELRVMLRKPMSVLSKPTAGQIALFLARAMSRRRDVNVAGLQVQGGAKLANELCGKDLFVAVSGPNIRLSVKSGERWTGGSFPGSEGGGVDWKGVPRPGGSGKSEVQVISEGGGGEGTLVFEGNSTGVFAVWKEGLIAVRVYTVEDVLSLAAPIVGQSAERTRLYARVQGSVEGANSADTREEYEVAAGMPAEQIMCLARECGGVGRDQDGRDDFPCCLVVREPQSGDAGEVGVVGDDGGGPFRVEENGQGLPLSFGSGRSRERSGTEAVQQVGEAQEIVAVVNSGCRGAVERARAYAEMGDADSALGVCDGELEGGGGIRDLIRLLCDDEFAHLLTARASVSTRLICTPLCNFDARAPIILTSCVVRSRHLSHEPLPRIGALTCQLPRFCPQIRKCIGDANGAAADLWQALELDSASPRALTAYAVIGIESLGDKGERELLDELPVVLPQCKHLLLRALASIDAGRKVENRLIACIEFHLGVIEVISQGEVKGAIKPWARDVGGKGVNQGGPTARDRRLEAAEERFRRAIDLDPRQSEYAINLASLLMTKGEDVDAEDLLRSVGDADLGAGGAYLLAGITGRRGKGGVRGAEAEKLLRRAVEETREGGVEAWEAHGGGRASLHDEARRLLGDMLRGNERRAHPEARRQYKLVLQSDPRNVGALVNFASWEWEINGQDEEALELYDRALAVDRNSYAALMGKANVLAERFSRNERRRKEAEQLFRHILAIRPGDPDALYNYGSFVPPSPETRKFCILNLERCTTTICESPPTT